MRTLTPTEMRRIERWARDTQIAAILVLSNKHHPPSAENSFLDASVGNVIHLPVEKLRVITKLHLALGRSSQEKPDAN